MVQRLSSEHEVGLSGNPDPCWDFEKLEGAMFVDFGPVGPWELVFFPVEEYTNAPVMVSIYIVVCGETPRGVIRS